MISITINDRPSGCPTAAQTFIHNAILFIDKSTSNNAWYNQAHWLMRTAYQEIALNLYVNRKTIESTLIYALFKVNYCLKIKNIPLA